jgi:hypothetical protein
MDVELDTSNELLLLSVITGLCNQEPRDRLTLEGMLLLLVKAQEARRQSPNCLD